MRGMSPDKIVLRASSAALLLHSGSGVCSDSLGMATACIYAGHRQSAWCSTTVMKHNVVLSGRDCSRMRWCYLHTQRPALARAVIQPSSRRCQRFISSIRSTSGTCSRSAASSCQRRVALQGQPLSTLREHSTAVKVSGAVHRPRAVLIRGHKSQTAHQNAASEHLSEGREPLQQTCGSDWAGTIRGMRPYLSMIQQSILTRQEESGDTEQCSERPFCVVARDLTRLLMSRWRTACPQGRVDDVILVCAAYFR